MRGYWRVLACIAEDANNFNAELGAKCNFVNDTDLVAQARLGSRPTDPRVLFLTRQPTKTILDGIDDFLRTKQMTLFLYELAEVNRVVAGTKTQTPPHKNLKAYWAGLGPAGPANRDSVGFMEAVGALAVDGWLRSAFALDTTVTLSDWFNVTPQQDSELRAMMQPGSPADLAAQLYFSDSWPVPVCLSFVTARPGWTHVNI